MNETITCPVCDGRVVFGEDFCPECAWVFEYHAGELTPQAATAYGRRLGKAKENWQKLKAMEHAAAKVQAAPAPVIDKEKLAEEIRASLLPEMEQRLASQQVQWQKRWAEWEQAQQQQAESASRETMESRLQVLESDWQRRKRLKQMFMLPDRVELVRKEERPISGTTGGGLLSFIGQTTTTTRVASNAQTRDNRGIHGRYEVRVSREKGSGYREEYFRVAVFNRDTRSLVVEHNVSIGLDSIYPFGDCDSFYTQGYYDLNPDVGIYSAFDGTYLCVWSLPDGRLILRKDIAFLRSDGRNLATITCRDEWVIIRLPLYLSSYALDIEMSWDMTQYQVRLGSDGDSTPPEP